jgi:hypothetical protein
MKQVSLSLLQPMGMHDRQSSVELFVVVSGSGGRPLLHHVNRPSCHFLIKGHVDGGNGRAATMAKMMNDASVTKPMLHK